MYFDQLAHAFAWSKTIKNLQNKSGHLLRPKINRTFKDTYRLQKSKLCFDVDAARIWNSAPTSITQAGSIYVVKKAIDAYVRTLPV